MRLLSFIGLFQVVLDVECPPDLLRALVPHHVGHLAAGDVQQPLDVQVVGGQDQVEQGLLVNLKKGFSMKSFIWLCKHTCRESPSALELEIYVKAAMPIQLFIS